MLNTISIERVVNLSDLMTTLFVMTESEREDFTVDVNVAYGDASYTLINARHFWETFIRGSLVDRINQAFPTLEPWLGTAKLYGFDYVNLEG
jgi:hypothetical protein